MEDLLAIIGSVAQLKDELESSLARHFEELDELFFGKSAQVANSDLPVKAVVNSVTPQQTKKRAKRLSSLVEDETDVTTEADVDSTTRLSKRVSNSQLLAVAEEEQQTAADMNTTGALMPPPPAPADTTLNSGRPQRAAKLRSEKNLKEAPLNSKLRRPTTEEIIKIKLEHEQRPSQFVVPIANSTTVSSEETTKVEDESMSNKTANSSRSLRVKVKREKLSNEGEIVPAHKEESTQSTETTLKETSSVLLGKETSESTMLSNTQTTNETTTSVAGKKPKKKKEAHRPIKIERFSELDKSSPIASRTRKGSTGKCNSEEQHHQPQRSIYEDAMENMPPSSNETRNLPADITVNKTMAMPDATMVLRAAAADATFDVALTLDRHDAGDATFAVQSAIADKENSLSSTKSMETAKDSSLPKVRATSLMTEDESLVEETPEPKPISKPAAAVPISAKAMKLPSRTHELFNPHMQSPVKMRVEAFENAANAQNTRSKRNKDEYGTPSSGTTPVIGKLPAPTLGRFLTPTQSSNVGPVNSAQPKKAPMSASKASTLLKTTSATNLKSANSGSSKTLSRENSGDDFRKGLHLLAEERKKQREQKHLQAAQLREAKERERAERMAKLAKEREEKRIKKLQEQERKKQELEELHRKQRQQEEADAAKKMKAKAIQEQEREMLQQMKQQQLNAAKAQQLMMPPPPKSKYTFEMLHEDDSTDDEGKVSYKRPPAPTWSRSHVRGVAINMQSHCPTDVIDSFFSVAPTTPDLKLIFPNIDPRHLKRNSSVLWSTPPRYSELPKY